MTAEYIDGVKLSDQRAVSRLLNGSPRSPNADNDYVLKNPKWDGVGSPQLSNKPITGGARAIMEILVSLFSIQIFKWGFVHCDPHPGNIIIRRRAPANTPQLVLIDHGLYITMPDDLRKDYARLWKALLSGDSEDMREIGMKWGIGKGSLDLLASGVLLKPWKSKPNPQTSQNSMHPFYLSLPKYHLAKSIS